jgi:hypothetical protein
MNIFMKAFWQDTFERAAKTFAQTFAPLLISSNTVGGLLEINWIGALSAAAVAALISVLMSIGTAKLRNEAVASLVPAIINKLDTGANPKK